LFADGAERYLAHKGVAVSADRGRAGADTVDAKMFDASAFAAMPEEVRLRLLLRAVNRFGHEGPADLGKVEALLARLDRCLAAAAGRGRPKSTELRLKQTLAGAVITLAHGRIRVEPAPRRRR
jgi:tRNA(Ile)-lysidine synthase